MLLHSVDLNAAPTPPTAPVPPAPPTSHFLPVTYIISPCSVNVVEDDNNESITPEESNELFKFIKNFYDS